MSKAGLLALVDTAMSALICALQDTNVLVEGALQESLAMVLLLQVELAADAFPPGHLRPRIALSAETAFMGHA